MFPQCVVGLMSLFSSVTCSGQEPRSTLHEQRRVFEEAQCSPAVAKTLLKERARDEFVDWTLEELPNDVKGTGGVLEGAMTKEAIPHESVRPFQVKEGVELAVRVFAARDSSEDDLVEYDWTYLGKPLRLVVSRNAIKLGFALDQLPACRQAERRGACVAAARAWVGEVLKLEGEYSLLEHHIEYHVDLPWPARLQDGVWFSSAPEQSLMRLRGMPFWHDRVDAFVEDGTLSILVYRKIGQLMGYQDGSKWFPDDFRALVHQKAREQGKLPPPKQEQEPPPAKP